MKCPNKCFCGDWSTWGFDEILHNNEDPEEPSRYHMRCPICKGHGWLPFWTPAERAGLKALGDGVLYAKENGLTRRTIELAENMVEAFEKAAQAVKERR